MNIKELAEQAGAKFDHMTWVERDLAPLFERFAELVAAAEREACARLCEEREEYQMPIPYPDGIAGCCVAHFVRVSKIKDGKECATAIRARGDKHD